MKLIAEPILVGLESKNYLRSCCNRDRKTASTLAKSLANVSAVDRQNKNCPIHTQTY
ncbi:MULTISPECIES: hypothetical protein [Kamptonema]|uniref:hypothetical protein n=1 Tax=Kamptonema TaxID=1501433 RepID=UPI000310A2AE|nr:MULTISPECIES: hypothetical protein [Kamptonema]